MAITIELQPENLTPAYNPVNYWFDSTNKNEDGFRYVVDVYEGVTSNKIGEYRIAPRITDGFGVVDLAKLLQNYVEPVIDFSTTFINSDDNYYEYDVKIGEEYRVTYGYTGFTQSGVYVELTGFSSHTFVAGNQINLTESVVGTNPLLTGLHSVISVTATTVVIDVIYSDMVAPSSIAGDIVYSDGRKTITRDIQVISGKNVWNAALPWIDFKGFDAANYINSINFMTNYPSGMKITEGQDLVFNFWNASASTRYAVFTNSDGDVLYKDITTAATNKLVGVPCGINNAGTLLVSSGSLPLIKTTTDYYTIQVTDNLFNPITQSVRIDVDRRCEIEPFHILFMDRQSSWGSFAFNLKAELSGKVERDTYNKFIEGSVDGGGRWSYNSYDGGLTNYYVSADEELTLRTNWMSVAENEYFKELITSPVTLLYVDGEYRNVIVQEGSYEVVRQRGKKLINKTIKVKLSTKDNING